MWWLCRTQATRLAERDRARLADAAVIAESENAILCRTSNDLSYTAWCIRHVCRERGIGRLRGKTQLRI